MNPATSPQWRGVLRLCLPALAVGAILRGLLAWALPFAYVQHDSFKLLFGDGPFWETEPGVASNTTFLVPWLYDLAPRCGLPGLIAIELGQHLLGLGMIVATGALIRLTFHAWRWFIVPGTLVIAVHPALLWYEHTVMAETVYVCAVVLLALAGAVHARFRGWASCAGLCAALYLTAVARPEGWLFLGFGGLLLLLTVEREKWRRTCGFFALFAVTAVAARSTSATHESGLLLYSSVLHFSPERSHSVPEAAPYVRALRQEAIAAAQVGPAFVSRDQRRALTAALEDFVTAHPQPKGGTVMEQVDRVARRLALETCRREWWRLPALAMDKFRTSACDLPSGEFSATWLGERQWRRLRNGWEYIRRHDSDLYGQRFATTEEFGEFIQAKYPPSKVAWFDPWSDAWKEFYQPRLPSTKYPSLKLDGLPYLFLLALAGMFAAGLTPGPARPFHLSWSAMLLGLWLVIMVTANERARFRFVFEPFVFLYVLALVDVLLAVLPPKVGWKGMKPRISRIDAD